MVYEDIILTVAEIACALGLYLFAGYAARVVNAKWRLLYLVPFFAALFVIAFFGFEISMAGVYLGAVLLVMGFIREEKRVRRLASVLAGFAMLLSVVFCNINSGYRMPDYAEDFKRGFEEMKMHYVLTEHKGIDWDALYDKYLPQFEEAEKNHDEAAVCIAWTAFSMEFYDMHVNYASKSDSVETEARERVCGNDYGLSLMKLSDGRTAAVSVEKDSAVYNAGIRNGTIITAWDGRSIDDAIKDTRENGLKRQNFTCAENEDFYEAIPVAGTGGDSVEISYLDENGTEQTIKADKNGFYAARWANTINALDKGAEISNLEWQSVNDKTVLLRMRFMNYDSKENFGQMEEEIRSKLLELKEEGVTNLIFDLRSNGGGSGSHVEHIVKLVAPEGEHTYIYDGVLNRDTMKYEKGSWPDTYKLGECETFQGENLWGHGQIIVLVNSQTVSAGDHFTWLTGKFPNVTVMGFTHSSCSGQGINVVNLGYGSLSYSAVLLLNEDGTVFLDTDESKKATVPLDVQIPFDEKALKAIFDEGEDYVLSCAVEYFGNH